MTFYDFGRTIGEYLVYAVALGCLLVGPALGLAAFAIRRGKKKELR